MSIVVASSISFRWYSELFIIDLKNQCHVYQQGNILIACICYRVAVGYVLQVTNHLRYQTLQEVLEVCENGPVYLNELIRWVNHCVMLIFCCLIVISKENKLQTQSPNFARSHWRKRLGLSHAVHRRFTLYNAFRDPTKSKRTTLLHVNCDNFLYSSLRW